jgi:inorganic pyrophosphatase
MGNGCSSKSSVQVVNLASESTSKNADGVEDLEVIKKCSIDTDQSTIAGSECTPRQFSHDSTAHSAFPVKTHAAGEVGTTSFTLKFSDASDQSISPWHDIRLHTEVNEVFNMICEIPKMTKAKFEVATKEPRNPIKQDIKKGKLREYHGPIYWNYGMFPQTWEDPNVEHPTMKCCGDNDPLDVVEIGTDTFKMGSVMPVKILGALAMLDEGEVDWKILAISTSDPLAEELNDVADIEKKCPGVVSGIREWFRWYKTPDGKSLNDFGYQGKALGSEEALKILRETHLAWQQLKSGACPSSGLWVD